MNEHDTPKPPPDEDSKPVGSVSDEVRCHEQLKSLKSDPSFLSNLRHDPNGCGTLMHLAEHCGSEDDRKLAITCLSITFSDEPTVRAFLFEQVRKRYWVDRDAALYGILANYAEDKSAIREIVSILHQLPPGEAADLLDACFRLSPGTAEGRNTAPLGVSDEAWKEHRSAVELARLRVLPNRNLHEWLFDMIGRDPDGPVELVLESYLPHAVDATPCARRITAWADYSETARHLSDRLSTVHPRWPRIDDYVQEFDSVAQRRVRGWRRRCGMFDRDLQYRQCRVAERMSHFPEQAEVRRVFEDMLIYRPSMFPVALDEQDYYRFDPVGWRRTAWSTLTLSHWTVGEATDFTRIVVELGPWDNEARKSKETIKALVCTWPNEDIVLAFLAEAERRDDVGAFVREDVATIRGWAQAGKDTRLIR